MADSSPRDLSRKFNRDPNQGGAINGAVTVGATSVLILQPRANRKRVSITNDSAAILYLAKADTAVLNSGYRVNANGGLVIDECDNLGYMYTGPWSAIGPGAGNNLCIVEEF